MEVLIGSSSLEHDFNVVLVFSQIRWVLFHIDHRPSLNEGVIGPLLSHVQSLSLIRIELAREIVTVNDSKDSAVQIQIQSQVQVLPRVVLRWGQVRLGHFVSLQEYALGDAGVFNTLLNDVEGVIFQVVIDNAFTDSEVFVGVLNNSFLEVSVELEDLVGIR